MYQVVLPKEMTIKYIYIYIYYIFQCFLWTTPTFQHCSEDTLQLSAWKVFHNFFHCGVTHHCEILDLVKKSNQFHDMRFLCHRNTSKYKETVRRLQPSDLYLDLLFHA